MDYKLHNGFGIAAVAVLFLAINQINCQHDRDIVLSPNITQEHPGKILYYNPVQRTANRTIHAQQDATKAQVNGRLGDMVEERVVNDNNVDEEVDDGETPWLEVLKHITYMVLADKVDQKYGSPQLTETSNNETESNRMKQKIQTAEYRPSYSNLASRFGDIVTLARGKLEQTSTGDYIFIELDSSGCLHNCEEERNLLQNVTAYWMVEKIRHKDVKRGHRFELRVTIFPIKKGVDSKRDAQIRVKSRTFLLKDSDYPKYFKEREFKYQPNSNRRIFDFSSFFQPTYNDLNIPFHVNYDPTTPYHEMGPLNTGEFFSRPPFPTHSLLHNTHQPFYEPHNTIETKYSSYPEKTTQSLVRFPSAEENDHHVHLNFPKSHPSPTPVTTMHLHHHYHRLPSANLLPTTLPSRYENYYPLDYRGVPSPALPEQTEKYVEPQQHLHEDTHQTTFSNAQSFNPPNTEPNPPRHYYDKTPPSSELQQHQFGSLHSPNENHPTHEYEHLKYPSNFNNDHAQSYEHISQQPEQHHKHAYNFHNQLPIPPHPVNSYAYHQSVSQSPFGIQTHDQIATPPRQVHKPNEQQVTTLDYNEDRPIHHFPSNYPSQLFAPNYQTHSRQNHRKPRPQHLPPAEASSVESPPHKEFRPSPEFSTNKYSDLDPQYHFVPTIRNSMPQPTTPTDDEDSSTTDSTTTDASPESTSPINEEEKRPNIITTTKGRYEIIPVKVKHLDVTEHYNPNDDKVELDIQEDTSTHRPHTPDSINAQLPPPENSDEFTVPYVDTSLKSIKTASPEATRSSSIAEYIPSSNDSKSIEATATTTSTTTSNSRSTLRHSLTPRPPTTTPSGPVSKSSTTEQTSPSNDNESYTKEKRPPSALKRRRHKVARTSTEMPVLKWMPRKNRYSSPKPTIQMQEAEVAESAVSPSTLDTELNTRQSVATSISVKVGDAPLKLRPVSRDVPNMSLEDRSITDSGINRLAKTIIERARRIE